MSETVQQQPVPRKTFFGTIITLPFTLFGVLCGSLLLSIIIEWLCVYFFWHDWQHAEQMFYFELEQFSDSFKHSLLLDNPTESINQTLEWLYQWVFIKTGLAEQLTTLKSDKTTTFREYLAMGYGYFHTYLIAAGYTILTFFIRIAILMLTMPLFALVIFVNFIDGLVKRDIRRFTAARESGFVYHRAKFALIPLLVLPWTVYLALPISIQPLLILLPSAILVGVCINITTSSFKKYL